MLPNSPSNFPISGTHMVEFTKRKNWSHQVIGELHDLYYVLTTSGKLMYCSPSSKELTGYLPTELVGKNIVEFIHVDDADSFICHLKDSITKGEFRFFYRFKRKNSTYIIFEVSGHPYHQTGTTTTKCFFNLARPYPLRVTSMLDTFLQLKLENELLHQNVQDMRSQLEEDSIVEYDEHNHDERLRENQSEPDTSVQPLDDELRNTLDLRGGGSASCHSSINTDDTRSMQSNQSQLMPDISTKKRKHKAIDDIERVCTECGTTDSPEWRKGPLGVKTLCNACGLRWSKKSRRESKNQRANSTSTAFKKEP